MDLQARSKVNRGVVREANPCSAGNGIRCAAVQLCAALIWHYPSVFRGPVAARQPKFQSAERFTRVELMRDVLDIALADGHRLALKRAIPLAALAW